MKKRMEMMNVLKRQQFDKKSKKNQLIVNNRSSLQRENCAQIVAPKHKICTNSVKIDVILKGLILKGLLP